MCVCVCVCVSLNLARLFLLVVSLVATNVSFHAFSHNFLNLPLSLYLFLLLCVDAFRLVNLFWVGVRRTAFQWKI